MAQEIKDLIAKIQQEGIGAAEEKAAQIKADAQSTAAKIISTAKLQAEKIIAQANADAKTLDDSTRATLKQAGRDLLISLKKEINVMLERLVKAELRQALQPEELSRIIACLIKESSLSLGSQIIVSLKDDDRKKLQEGFFKQLAEETRKQITLSSADGIESGFLISFDAGKSVFDFSAQALTEYICGSLRPELSQILNGA